MSSITSTSNLTLVRTVITSSQVWNKPLGHVFSIVRLQAPGANGGALSGTRTKPSASAGGGAGGYCEKRYDDATMPASVSVTIATAGGNSIFYVMQANGGGAAGVNADSSIALGGTGGTASGGDINAKGGDGSIGNSTSSAASVGGRGGDAVLGGGTKESFSTTATPSAGVSAGNYGSGGGGASVGSTGASSVSSAGGTAGASICIVDSYVRA